MTKSGRAACTRSISSTEHTTPPQPASIARASRSSNALASGSLVSTVTAIGVGGSRTGVARAFRESFDTRAQHVDTARGVEVEVANALATEHARRPSDRRRDVVQLDVGEHVEVERAHARDRLGPGGGVQLEARPWRRRTTARPPWPAVPPGRGRGRRARARAGSGRSFVGVASVISAVPPIRSRTRATSLRAHHAPSSSTMRSVARGSRNVAVPTPTADAPASSISTASSPVLTPPVPMIGDPGMRARDLPHRAQRDRFDRRTRDPAAARAEARRARRRVDTRPITVLTSVRPVAPASSAAPAIATRSVTFGDSFANTGAAPPSASTTACVASRVVSGACANTWARASTFGHERLTSTATTRSATSFNARAAASKSATVRPQIDAMTRAPRASSAGRSSRDPRVDARTGQPDRVDHPAARRLRDAQRRVALRREHRDRLRGHRADARAGRTAPRPRRRARTCPTRRRSGFGNRNGPRSTVRSTPDERGRRSSPSIPVARITPRTGAGRRRGTPAASAPRARARPPRRCRPPPRPPPRPS